LGGDEHSAKPANVGAVQQDSKVLTANNPCLIFDKQIRPGAVCCPEIYRDVPGSFMKISYMLFPISIYSSEWVADFNPS